MMNQKTKTYKFLNSLFFDIFLVQKDQRKKNPIKEFQDLPNINIEIFLPDRVEKDYPSLHLSHQLYEQIWDIQKNYSFCNDKALSENVLDLESIVYLFEKMYEIIHLSDKRKFGSYFTPKNICDYMVDLAIKNRVIKLLKQQGEEENNTFLNILSINKPIEDPSKINRNKLSKIFQNLRVFDPSCGCGAFLLACANYLFYNYTQVYFDNNTKLSYYSDKKSNNKKISKPFSCLFDIKIFILENNLFGTEISSGAIRISKTILWLWAHQTRNLGFIQNLDINPQNCKFDDIRFNIKLLNFLEAQNIFPEFFNSISAPELFDIIIGNPPYVPIRNFQNNVKEFLKNYSCYHANGDIYFLFSEKSLKLLKPSGYMNYIIPRYFLKSITARKLRGFLSNYYCQFIYDFGSLNIFQGIGVHTLILLVANETSKEDLIVTYIQEAKEDSGKENKRQKITLPLSYLSEKPWIFIHDPFIEEIKKKAKYNLDNICFISKGVQTGKDQVFVVSRKTIDQFNLENESIRPWIKNSDILKFKIKKRKESYIIFSTFHTQDQIKNFKNTFNYLLKNRNLLENRSRINKWYQWRKGDERSTIPWNEPKIITPFKSKKNFFALDKKGHYSSQDVVIIRPRDKYKHLIFYLLALLNSELIFNFVEYEFKELSKGNYEFYPNQLKKIPVLIPEDSILEKINFLVKDILETVFNQEKKEELDTLINEIYNR